MEPGRDIIEQAALWHARLGDDSIDDSDQRRAFEAWRSTDPLHALAFERIATLDTRLRSTQRAERIALKKLATNKKRALPLALLLCAVIITAWQARQLPAVAIRLADYRTLPGAQSEITLADGSRLTLGTGTALNAHVGAHTRSLQLLQGEILVNVEKNPAAPFVVHTQYGTARALGTAYSVRSNATNTVVTVVRSCVEVCNAQQSRCETLTPGQRARIDTSGVTRLGDVDIDEATAWSHGWLAVNDMPLAQMLAELNRYRETPIRFEAQALVGMNVSGHFPLRDMDRTLQAITRSLPIAVDGSDTASPLVRRR